MRNFWRFIFSKTETRERVQQITEPRNQNKTADQPRNSSSVATAVLKCSLIRGEQNSKTGCYDAAKWSKSTKAGKYATLDEPPYLRKYNDQLSLTNPRDALQHSKRAANK